MAVTPTDRSGDPGDMFDGDVIYVVEIHQTDNTLLETGVLARYVVPDPSAGQMSYADVLAVALGKARQ